MTLGQPQTKSNEIIRELTALSELNEFTFRVFKKKINEIPDLGERFGVLGILYRLKDDDKQMCDSFETALRYDANHVNVYNYAISLKKTFMMEDCAKLVMKYPNTLGNDISLFIDVFVQLLDAQSLNNLKENIKNVEDLKTLNINISKIETFKEKYDINMNHFEKIVRIYNSILRNYQIGTFDIDFLTYRDFYVIEVQHNNINDVVSMNFELAEKISVIDELNEFPLTFVFRPAKSVEKLAL